MSPLWMDSLWSKFRGTSCSAKRDPPSCAVSWVTDHMSTRKTKNCSSPTPHWVVSVGGHPNFEHNNCVFTRHYSHDFFLDVVLPFYYIGVWVSIPFDIRWYILCVGFPTNRMLFCVGSKRVCGGRWGGVVACRAGGGLLINGLIVPVVICSSHPCASAWHFVQLTKSVGRRSNSLLS